MNPSKPTAVAALELAVACHRRFLDHIASQFDRENVLYGEVASNTPENTAKLAMHKSAMDTLANTAKEFAAPPTSATPNYTHYLQEIKRLLDLRCGTRLTALSTVSSTLVSLELCSTERQQWLVALGTETGQAQAMQNMYNIFILLVDPYFHFLQGA